MRQHVFTGFGFGPVQGGLFANEAFQSGNFGRIVIAEIDQKIVDAVRANKGTYFVNVAKAEGIDVVKIDEVELLNPCVETDRDILLEAVSESTEIATCLPSVSFYTMGDNSVARQLVDGLKSSKASATIIYAAENNNRAAEILQDAVIREMVADAGKNVQFLNTVIGKMSRVVTDPAEIEKSKLTPIAPGVKRAFLVEEFNRILVTRCMIKEFEPGIGVFVEKEELLAFEEAKLYGHNAIHALLAYLGLAKGYKKMTKLKDDVDLMKIASKAFLNESGAALIKKYSVLGDELFTERGYKCYAEDLLERMTNPYLGDTTIRAGRDIVRKLGYSDRIFGTMTLALEYGVEPVNMAIGAAAALCELLANSEESNLPKDLCFTHRQELSGEKIQELLRWLWGGYGGQHREKLTELIHQALPRLKALLTKQ
jgi:mannitol-1-phosphate 5-dehydrogenase